MSSPAKLLSGLIALSLATATPLLLAADVTWTGSSSGNWHDGSNWDGATPPTTDDIARFSGTITNTPLDLGANDAVIQAFNYSGAGAFTLNSSGGGRIVIDSGLSNNFLSTNLNFGALTVNAGIVIRNGQTDRLNLNINPSGNLILNGVVSEGDAGPRQLRKTGGGIVFLNDANTFSGGIRLEAGTIRLNHTQAAGTGPINWIAASGSGAIILGSDTNLTVGNDLVFSPNSGGTGEYRIQTTRGTTLEFTTSSIINDTITEDLPAGKQVVIQNNNAGPDAPAFVVFSGVDIDTTLSFRVNGNTNDRLVFAPAAGGHQRWAGAIAMGGANGWLIKSGAGTSVLEAVNVFNGNVRVNEGLLVVNGSLNGQSSFTVHAGGVVGGVGTIGGAANGVVISGAVAPGFGGIGTLTSGGNVAWNGGVDWQFNLGPGNTADLLSIVGNFTKGTGDTFGFNFGGAGAVGSFTLVEWSGTTSFVASEFTYTNLADGFSGEFQIQGNQLIFAAIPEPSTYALLLGVIALGCLVLRRLRR